MKPSLLVILVGSHLSALGAGWWCLGKRGPAPINIPASALATKSERSPRLERRVSTADLLAAYRDPKLRDEAAKRRFAELSQGELPRDVAPSAAKSSEQRAAEIADIAAALQKEVETLDAGKRSDYKLAKALIVRWMKEDPAACAAWLGQVKMRVAWHDLWAAFAETLAPTELIKLMDHGWLQRNREMALRASMQHMGKTSPADLPAALALLDAKAVNSYLDEAYLYARVEDAVVWLQLASGDIRRLQLLGNRWISGPGLDWKWEGDQLVPSNPWDQNWLEKAEAALAAVTGTPAEEIFRKKLEYQLRESEKGRELARVALEPADALVDLYLQRGEDEAEARRKASADIWEKYRDGLSDWQRESWEQDLRLSLAGQRELEDVLIGRLDSIGTELPEVLQEVTRGSAWRDAMLVDSVVTLEVARQTGRMEEVVKSATALVRQVDTSLSAQADILLALAAQGLWEQTSDPSESDNRSMLPKVAFFAAGYLRDDPEAARLWISRLPSSLSQFVKEVAR